MYSTCIIQYMYMYSTCIIQYMYMYSICIIQYMYMYSTCIVTYRCTCTVCLLFTDGIEVSGDSSEDETGGTISKTFTNVHA